jgi:hypothetical protein
MNFTARVAVIFTADDVQTSGFDLWEVALAYNARDHRHALEEAISVSRRVLDLSENWRALGYRGQPTYYAVVTLNSTVEVPNKLGKNSTDCFVLNRICSLNKSDVETLASFKDILLKYHIIHKSESTN